MYVRGGGGGYEPQRRLTRAQEFYGAGADKFFTAPRVVPPWPQGGRRRDVEDWDEKIVHDAVRNPHNYPVVSVDPREPRLHATQPFVIEPAARYYMTDEYRQTGRTWADQNQSGNRVPFVYDREGGESLLLSGHHRATAALLQGRQFDAVRVEGPWGPPRPR
jgi:hypothetical protein